MVDHPEAPPKDTAKGLFETYLGNLSALYEDAHRHPDKYEEDTRELIDRLMHQNKGTEGASPQEKEMLDKAVLDFLGSAPPQPEPSTPKEDVGAAEQSPVSLEEERGVWAPPPEEIPSEGIPGAGDVPAGATKPYWWL
jgi:hypothetical protein